MHATAAAAARGSGWLGWLIGGNSEDSVQEHYSRAQAAQFLLERRYERRAKGARQVGGGAEL